MDFLKMTNRFLTPICPEPTIGTHAEILEICFCTFWSRGLFFKILEIDFEPFFVLTFFSKIMDPLYAIVFPDSGVPWPLFLKYVLIESFHFYYQ